MIKNIVLATLIIVILPLSLLAETCPNMSKTGTAPSGWTVSTKLGNKPAKSGNAFLSASYSTYPLSTYQKHVMCTYTTQNYNISYLLSTSTYSNIKYCNHCNWQPALNDKNKILVCTATRKKCTFS